VLIQDEALEDMLDDLDELGNPDEILCPKTYSWPEKRLCITILPDES